MGEIRFGDGVLLLVGITYGVNLCETPIPATEGKTGLGCLISDATAPLPLTWDPVDDVGECCSRDEIPKDGTLEFDGKVGDEAGDVLLIFGDADINRGGDAPLPNVDIDDEGDVEVLIKLAWWAIIAWWAAAAWCTALHCENNAGGRGRGSGFSLDEFSVYNWGSEVGGRVGGTVEFVSNVGGLFGVIPIAGGDVFPFFGVVTVGGAGSDNWLGVDNGGGANPGGGTGAPEADAANAAADAAPGNSCPAPGWLIGVGIGPSPGGGRPLIIIMALAFSAAIAAAIKLLFSASESNGDLKRKEGSIPGGIIPYGSLEIRKRHYDLIKLFNVEYHLKI